MTLTALVTAMFVIAASCAPQDNSGTESAAVHDAAPLMSVNDNLSWGDDYAHYVVTTSNTTVQDAAVDSADVAVEPGSLPGLSRAVHGRSNDEIIVHYSDGTTVTLTLPIDALTATGAADDAEIAAIAAAGTGAIIVIDTAGLAGPAGVRYVLRGDDMSELAPIGPAADTTASTETTETTVAPESTSPATTLLTDTAIVDRISQIDGVREVDWVGPGIIRVTTEIGDHIAVEISEVGGVVSVGEDALGGLHDDLRQGEQWALANTGATSQVGSSSGPNGVTGADIAAPAAWEVTKGAGVVVAVIDTGVELSHPDLAGQAWVNPDENCTDGLDNDGNHYIDDCNGWDFFNGDNDVTPDAGGDHGTHVAGIIAAAANEVGIVGVAPEANVMALKVSTPNLGIAFSATVAAVKYATAEGARVINLSLGWTSDQRPRLQLLVDAIADATASGVLVVASAGNDHADISAAPPWPAGLSMENPGVVAVGASTNSDTLAAAFSNYGTPVNIVAPGRAILSSVGVDGWAFYQGTSMAAPQVAGAAALVFASGAATTPSGVRARLVATADMIPMAVGGQRVLPRLNAAAAVGRIRPGAVSVAYTGTGTLAPGSDGTIGVVVSAAANTKVTQLRLSVATLEGAAIAAIEGLTAAFSGADAVTTNEFGAFPAIQLSDSAGLNGPGTTIDATLNLATGEYAFVTELLDSDGTAVGGAQVAYLSVSDAPPTTDPTLPAVPVTTSPIPTTNAPSSGGGAVTTVAPVTVPAGTTTPKTTVTTTPASGGSATTAAAVTVPATTAPKAPATTTPAGGGGPGSTAPPVTLPSATTAPKAPQTTAPRTTGPPSSGPATTAPATTTPATTTPATTTPATTTPATTTSAMSPLPPPDHDGLYSVTAINPNSAALCGETPLGITGQFPTDRPVYVWFGPTGPVETAIVNATTLTFNSPCVLAAGRVDVTVKFTALGHTYNLTLANAFTFSPTGTGTAPGTTVPATNAPGATAPATTAPHVTVPASTVPAGTGPAITNPAVTAPATTTPRSTAPATTEPPPIVPPTTTPVAGLGIGSRGTLTLRSLPSGGALSLLSNAEWPASGCHRASCTTSRL